MALDVTKRNGGRVLERQGETRCGMVRRVLVRRFTSGDERPAAAGCAKACRALFRIGGRGGVAFG